MSTNISFFLLAAIGLCTAVEGIVLAVNIEGLKMVLFVAGLLNVKRRRSVLLRSKHNWLIHNKRFNLLT